MTISTSRKSFTRIAIVVAGIMSCICLSMTVVSTDEGNPDRSEKFIRHWRSLVQAESDRMDDSDVVIGADVRRIAAEWRNLIRNQPAGAIRYRAQTWGENADRLAVMIEATVKNRTVAGPAAFEILSKDGNPIAVSVVEGVSNPPPILTATLASWVFSCFISVALLYTLRRNREFLMATEANWAGRQAFLIIHPLAGLCLSALFVAGFSTFDSWFMRRLIFGVGGSAPAVEFILILVYIVLGVIFALIFCLPYFAVLRRAPRKIIDSAPGSFSKRRIARTITLEVTIQLVVGAAMWGGAMWLATRLGFSRLIAGGGAGFVSVWIAQYVWVWTVRRAAVAVLSDDHPTVLAAINAFESIGLASAARRIYVLPAERWPYPNAYVMGIGRRRCVVAVTEPLLDCLQPKEAAGVLLHEYAHLWERHTILLVLCVSLMATWELIFALEGRSWLAAAGLSSKGAIALVHQLSLYAGWVFCLLIPFTSLSRWCERRADAMAHRLGWGAWLAAALLKISAATETPVHWPAWFRWLSTHPSYSERIEALRSVSNDGGSSAMVAGTKKQLL